MPKKNSGINLVKKRVDYFDEFIKWALSVGRLVVIVTEVVALLTFLFRFSLDQKVIDLHSKIQQEQAIVTSLKDQELTFRNLQERLALAQDVSKKSQEVVKVISDVEKNIPSDASVNTISLFEDGVRVQATFKSVTSLSKFVDFLKSYDQIKSVSIDKIENKSSSASIIVQMTGTFRTAPQR